MIVMVSGGFDPVHIGHIELIHCAATYGQVVVALNSDEWLIRKKGYTFHRSWMDRYRILIALRAVHCVVAVDDADGTVCEALRKVRPNYFANGGDRKWGEPSEVALCQELMIDQLWGVGGEKSGSSSELVREAIRSSLERPTA